MSNIIAIDLSTLILNGTVIQGFSDDAEALSFASTGDFYDTVYGADGFHIHGRTGNIFSATMTIKLLATSPSVAFFQEALAALKSGLHIEYNGYVEYNDGSNATITSAVIAKPPVAYTLGSGVAKEMEYTFNVGRFVHDVAGRVTN